MQLGQEAVQLVRNETGAQLLNGHAVRVVGASGDRMLVSYVDTAAGATSVGILGLLTENVDNSGEGFVTTNGLVRDLDTSAWAPGTPLHVHSNGELGPTHPTSGFVVQIGYVITQDSAAGSIFVSTGQTFNPIAGQPCSVPGVPGTGVFAWTSTGGARYYLVCDM